MKAKIKLTKAKFKPSGAMIARFKEFEQEHLDWLAERICKNCKWWDSTTYQGGWGKCNYKRILFYVNGKEFISESMFGCNQWEKNN